MKLSIVLAFILLSAQAAFSSDAIVYFFTGAPVEGPRGKSMDIMTDYMAKSHPTAKFTITHNSHWKDACKAIVVDKKLFPNEKVVLSGHSYGGQATITVSNCLKKVGINVDTIIPLDPVQKPFEPAVDVVPDNVNIAYSFFQKQDLFIRGNDHLHRADGTETRVSNTLTTTDSAAMAHHNMVDVLVNAGVVQGLISETLK